MRYIKETLAFRLSECYQQALILFLTPSPSFPRALPPSRADYISKNRHLIIYFIYSIQGETTSDVVNERSSITVQN